MSNGLQWARKYRPKTLEEFVGNDFLKTKLTTLLTKDKLPQTILLTGTQGTGKTTLARLLSKSILCQHRMNGQPCHTCDTCQLMDDGYIPEGVVPRGANVYEYDIGKSNTVRDANEIIVKMKQRVSEDTVRVFILDEIQRATAEAQSSFLKITEETPPNVYILLCTTNPEDLIAPFKSRFNTFEVKKPKTEELVLRLKTICEQENVRHSDAGLTLIVDNCKRIPRDSIMKMEVISSIGEVKLSTVEQELGVINTSVYNRYLEILNNRDMNELLLFIEELTNTHNLDTYDFMRGLSDYMIDLLYIDKGIILDRYTEGIIRSMKRVNRQIKEPVKLEIIKEFTEIINRGFNGNFILLGITLKLMDVVKEHTVVVTPVMTEEEVAKTNYREVTGRVQAEENKIEDKELDMNDFIQQFSVVEKNQT